MLGSGLGLLESSERAPLVLEQLERVTSQSARILAEGLDPVFGEVPAIHAAYHAMNRSRGLLPGQIRLRVRFRELSTPWFDWLFCSPSELRLNAL